jgi:hypothetical protein
MLLMLVGMSCGTWIQDKISQLKEGREEEVEDYGACRMQQLYDWSIVRFTTKVSVIGTRYDCCRA